MKYKVNKCLKCGSSTCINDDEELFCSQCGAPVLNKCACYDCQTTLPSNAKYCKICGSPSIFFNYGLFNPVLPTTNDELPF